MFPYVIVIVFCEKINCLVLSVAYQQGYYVHCGAVATSSSYPMTLSILVQCLKTKKKKNKVIAFSPSRVETIGRWPVLPSPELTDWLTEWTFLSSPLPYTSSLLSCSSRSSSSRKYLQHEQVCPAPSVFLCLWLVFIIFTHSVRVMEYKLRKLPSNMVPESPAVVDLWARACTH